MEKGDKKDRAEQLNRVTKINTFSPSIYNMYIYIYIAEISSTVKLDELRIIMNC